MADLPHRPRRSFRPRVEFQLPVHRDRGAARLPLPGTASEGERLSIRCRPFAGRAGDRARVVDVNEETTVDRLRQKITYANVTATLALFIALGGTGYAA